MVPASAAPPVISGWPLTSGSVLTATSSWTGAGLNFAYTWARCDPLGVNCVAVASGPSPTYTLTQQDVNSTVTVTVTASNAAGSTSATSLPTARIASASSAPASGPVLGVHSDLTFYNDPSFHSAVIDADVHLLHPAVSRNSLLWHNIEATKGTFDWGTTDDVVNKLVAAGIKPEFTVYGSPSWANGVSTSVDDFYLYVPQDPTAFQRWVSDYAAFLRAAASRYAGRVNLWECGNEENEHYFWKPVPNVNQYLTWYTACRTAILSGNPNAEVAVGGLAGLLYSGAGDINGKAFLQQLIAFGAPIDHVAIHPYSIHNQSPDLHVPWDGNFDDIGQIRDFLDSEGLQNVDIWVTEWGWDSGVTGLQTQADDVLRSLQLLMTDFKYVSYAFYFCDFDRPGYGQGLLDSNLNPKPAAAAFAQFAHGEGGGPAG